MFENKMFHDNKNRAIVNMTTVSLLNAKEIFFIYIYNRLMQPFEYIILQGLDLSNIFRFDFLQNTRIKISVTNIFYFSKVITHTVYLYIGVSDEILIKLQFFTFAQLKYIFTTALNEQS